MTCGAGSWSIRAGLHAPALAQRIAGLPSDRIPAAYYAKGNYFTLTGRSPFSRLIYPVPVPGGLGVHLTIDLGGQARFGPDVEWIDGIDYTVDPRRADKFYAAVRRYWPGLQGRRAAAGLRRHPPEDRAPGAPAQDFVVQGPADARRGGAGQPVRHRIARPHRLAGAGRAGARHRGLMSLARRGLFAGLAGALGGCSPAALLNATVSRQGYTLERDIAYVASFSDLLHKRAPTRENVLAWLNSR